MARGDNAAHTTPLLPRRGTAAGGARQPIACNNTRRGRTTPALIQHASTATAAAEINRMVHHDAHGAHMMTDTTNSQQSSSSTAPRPSAGVAHACDRRVHW